MLRPYRKLPGRAAKSEGSAPDVITQTELASAAKLQSEAWQCAEKARNCAKEIENRIRRGAVVAPGALTFDRRFQIAVRKPDTTASGHGGG
jgi:hypothetical protein